MKPSIVLLAWLGLVAVAVADTDVRPEPRLRYDSPVPKADPPQAIDADLRAYGATPAGVTAAIQGKIPVRRVAYEKLRRRLLDDGQQPEPEARPAPPPVGTQLKPAPPHIFHALAAGKKQTVVVYGTSLSHGGAWAGAVKEWFDEHYPGLVTVINNSGPGQNSTWGVENLQAKVLDLQPDLVFVEFSYNDAVERFRLPVEKAAANLATIVDRILGQDPGTAVVLQVMNVGWDAPNGRKSFSVRPELERYNENYRTCARSRGLPLLDHYAAWSRLKESDAKRFQALVPDGSHPTKEGSLAVTWPTVKAWLEAARQAAAGGD